MKYILPIETVFASGNQHKAQELQDLLDSNLISLNPASEAVFVEENSGSFQGNALLKAKAYFEKYHQVVLSDDSGLVVEALPGELGVESANYGGPGLNGEQRARKLLVAMSGLPDEQRAAYFVCHLCLYLGQEEYYFFEGRMKGKLAMEYRGDGGFGYDPIFIPEKGEGQKTLAEQSEWKQAHSHRSQAAKGLNQFLLKGIANFR